jgi:hypothetical protein
MDEAEIRAEIERRRKRAIDLKLRETVWSIYSSQFQYMDDYLKKEPDSILPEVKSSLRRSDGLSEFDFAGLHFGLRCAPGKIERDGRGFDSTERTEMTLSLSVNGKSVLEFEMHKSVTYGEDMPYFSEYMGRVKAFIEGPWVDQVGELLKSMRAYKQEYLKRKNAPREAQRLRQDMKSFGLE